MNSSKILKFYKDLKLIYFIFLFLNALYCLIIDPTFIVLNLHDYTQCTSRKFYDLFVHDAVIDQTEKDRLYGLVENYHKNNSFPGLREWHRIIELSEQNYTDVHMINDADLEIRIRDYLRSFEEPSLYHRSDHMKIINKIIQEPDTHTFGEKTTINYQKRS